MSINCISEIKTNSLSVEKYNLDEVIETINTRSKMERLKVALFVGKDNLQPLPKEEGWLWVSLDCEMFESTDSNRLHLKMDFNNPGTMRKINQIFNKVVVDFSVVKFFDKPWENLPTLLVQKKDSELIVEAYSGLIQYLDKDKIEDALKDPNNLNIKFPLNPKERAALQGDLLCEWNKRIESDSFLRKIYREEMNNFVEKNPGQTRGHFVNNHKDTLEREYCLKQLTDTSRVYLKKLFKNVDLCHEYYPYKDLSECKEGPVVFWRMRSPVSQSDDPLPPSGILFCIKSVFNFLLNALRYFFWTSMASSLANVQNPKADNDHLQDYS